MKSLTPEMMVDDLLGTVEYYEDVLGFNRSLIFPDNSPFFAILSKEKIEIMLYARQQFSQEIPSFASRKIGGSMALYARVDDVVSEWHRMESRIKVIQKLHKTNYGSEEFSFVDINGYVWIYYQRD